ncbi:sigma factor-like helix-turn-helix DNA-binding protein [Thiorhodovibrio frisius]|uniref:sigma factor-like helix-turn-helix DNA-binding protein n=1 Tax=Thiorhodovibrio frisius TaxID=631362 RepID=UPI00022C70BB|nr:sigma factor-like helix-turn-helix DNA-binding protein [Thiorhodovibrio frisius]WPL21865.1 RNA polymerase sigma factor, sigma-70 family [Thiorhodovibrio frisius]
MHITPVMDHEEIAEQLGISVIRVKNIEKKALAKLKRYMERHFPIEPDELVETIGHSSLIAKTPHQ